MDELERTLRAKIAELRGKLFATEHNYSELLMAVGKKHEGETRHQTALRYLREAEQADEWATQPASLEP